MEPSRCHSISCGPDAAMLEVSGAPLLCTGAGYLHMHALFFLPAQFAQKHRMPGLLNPAFNQKIILSVECN